MERELWERAFPIRHVEITDKNVVKWKESSGNGVSHRHVEIVDKNVVKWKEELWERRFPIVTLKSLIKT